MLLEQEILSRAQFCTAGFVKIPRDQIKDDLAPQTEFWIIVNRPANLKVYLPSRNEVLMRLSDIKIMRNQATRLFYS